MTQTELLPALQFTPPAISFNFEDLKDRISDITEKYTGLVVQEDDVPAIKSEMAGLNRLAAELANAKKDAVAQISMPIKEFESQIKSIEADILKTRTFLDDQVKAHVLREREGRRHKVQVTIDVLKDDNGCSDLNIPIQDSWLNKSIKDKAIAAEVQAIILAHKRQQEEAANLEQAKKDRVVALEEHCKAMEQTRSYSLAFSYFAHLQGLDIPLTEALAKVCEIYTAEDQRRTAIKAEEISDKDWPPHRFDYAGLPPATPKPEPHFMDALEPPAAPTETKPVKKAMTITATYNAENGKAISTLYQQIKALCLTCTAQVNEIPHG